MFTLYARIWSSFLQLSCLGLSLHLLASLRKPYFGFDLKNQLHLTVHAVNMSMVPNNKFLIYQGAYTFSKHQYDLYSTNCFSSYLISISSPDNESSICLDPEYDKFDPYWLHVPQHHSQS